MSDIVPLLHILGGIATAVRFALHLVAAVRWWRDRQAKKTNVKSRRRRADRQQTKPPRARGKGGRRRRSRRIA